MTGSSDRVALVTGGGTGIGRAIAHRLVEAGFAVVVSGRRLEPLDATVASSATPERCRAVAADVRCADSVDLLFDAAMAWRGRLDLLVNNAGVLGCSAPVESFSAAEWKLVLDVNLTGAFLCARRAFREMRAQRPRGGRIVNNGSLSAHVPRPHSIAYTVAKHGMTGLTKSLALEGRAHDIACGQIDIGNAATAMTERLPEPTIDVRHVADAVLYIASLPLGATVPAMTLMATGMPYLGRG